MSDPSPFIQGTPVSKTTRDSLVKVCENPEPQRKEKKKRDPVRKQSKLP